MSYETIKLAAVRALLGTCTSRAISAELTDSDVGRLYFSGVNESHLEGGITLHYEESVIFDTWRIEYSPRWLRRWKTPLVLCTAPRIELLRPLAALTKNTADGFISPTQPVNVFKLLTVTVMKLI